MAGPINVSAIAEAAVRVVPRAGETAQHALPFVTAGDDVIRTVGTTFDRDAADAIQLAMDAPQAMRPRVVIVGIGRTPPKTTQSLIEAAVKQGMVPGEDIISTNYASLRVGKDRGFVRLAEGTGADGMLLAGKGRETLFLFRGGGNLKETHFNKIAAIQSVDGATALTDLGFIQRAGSKSITNDRLKAAGLALADTIPVTGKAEAVAAFDKITQRFGADTAVLKKVNSLGGKDVHFVQSHDDIAKVIAADPEADFVVQEFLPFAKDQDIRVHMVWSSEKQDFEIANSYVRNRKVGGMTPNLANDGFPTHYELSPWEQEQAIKAARVLAEGSPHAPLHVGLDFFPRQAITASTVERNAKLQQAVADGTMSWAEAVSKSEHSVVIGEAASSAGTKGTEMVLGAGNNPVVRKMVEEIIHIREHGVSRTASFVDAVDGSANLGRPRISRMVGGVHGAIAESEV
ncbi:MAG: putative alpha-L-glutamate ligase [Thermoleophilia bacterium]|nr:putative alpha-L-glutamate ligase [Thermoleophilia bacterium]